MVFAQNHDQVGNRPGGERLSRLVSFEARKLAAGVVLLSPYVPLLFMGEEYGETAPFEYFVSHSDQSLIDAVRRGRREEFTASRWRGKPADPQDESTFLRAKVNHDLRCKGSHRVLLEFYRELIRLRRQVPALRMPLKENLEVHGFEAERVLKIRRWSDTEQVAAVFHFGEEMKTLSIPLPKGRWEMIFDSAAERWQGPGGRGAGQLISRRGCYAVSGSLVLCPLSRKDGAGGLMERYICIHGHFYQPPRENPWLEAIEVQDSAYPYHDWNERITAECYATNAASHILDPQGRIVDIVNNYAKISFNFGPTLLAWLKEKTPEVYESILLADRESRERFSGHGSAMAQPYNHVILPLANRRDKYTQILWGIRDFEARFEREPEGMWLPETAVDLESLDILAELGIRFTILAPRQASKVRAVERH